jgi:hypothetical protein
MTDIYTPSTSPVSSISSKPLDPTRCKAGVWGNERWTSYAQCSRKAGADGWCKQHHPDAQKKRAAAADEKYQASLRKSAMGWYGEQFMVALIKIRDGDNDPRSTAAEALVGVSYAEKAKK